MVVGISQDERYGLTFSQPEAGEDCIATVFSGCLRKGDSRTGRVIFTAINGGVELQ